MNVAYDEPTRSLTRVPHHQPYPTSTSIGTTTPRSIQGLHDSRLPPPPTTQGGCGPLAHRGPCHDPLPWGLDTGPRTQRHELGGTHSVPLPTALVLPMAHMGPREEPPPWGLDTGPPRHTGKIGFRVTISFIASLKGSTCAPSSASPFHWIFTLRYNKAS